MCGLIAIVALAGNRPKSAAQSGLDLSQRLSNGLAQIKHRGPDSQGQWVSQDGRIALGHVRLRINDLNPTGDQPLHDEEQTLHAVVNGELYEYDRLRAEMIEKIGYKFKGRSDCELVLALYKCHGLNFLLHLRGEFSLCMYDSQQDLFIAVRDRYGIKPLFWTIVGQELFVAAEMKAFIPLGWSPEWNIQGIVDGSFQMSPTTIFKRVQKVRAGHMLTIQRGGDLQEGQYWDMNYPDKVFSRSFQAFSADENVQLTPEIRTEADMIEGLRSHLLDAVRIRLRADVKVGVALSGGIDSSVIAGMVNHLIREGEKPLTKEAGLMNLASFLGKFGIPPAADIFTATAERTATHLGVHYFKQHMDEQALADCFEDATWFDEQPNPDLNFVGLYALSALERKQGFRVILNGQGADEIFGGYPLFLSDYLRKPDQAFSIDGFQEHPRTSALSKIEEQVNAKLTERPDIKSPLTSNLLANTLTPAQMISAYPILPLKASVLPPGHHSGADPRSAYSKAISSEALMKMSKAWHPFHTAQYVFSKGHLENLLLSCLGDRGEMAHSIEGRTPFLDHHLTEYANNLPPSMKIRPKIAACTLERSQGDGLHGDEFEFVEKYVLREAARPFITDEIYRKRKHPYTAPLRYPTNGPLHQLLKKLITYENIAKLGFLEWRYGTRSLGDLVDEAFTNHDESVFRLMICIAQWIIIGTRFGVKTTEIQAKM